MCLFIGVLFLVGLPLTVISGTFTGDPVFVGILWLACLFGLLLRVRQTIRQP